MTSIDLEKLDAGTREYIQQLELLVMEWIGLSTGLSEQLIGRRYADITEEQRTISSDFLYHRRFEIVEFLLKEKTVRNAVLEDSSVSKYLERIQKSLNEGLIHWKAPKTNTGV